MSDLSDFLKAGFDEALGIMGESCNVDGTVCNGVWSQLDRGNELTETAYGDEVSASVSISKTDFPSQPNVRCDVIRNNTTYIAVSIEENDSGWVLAVEKEV